MNRKNKRFVFGLGSFAIGLSIGSIIGRDIANKAHGDLSIANKNEQRIYELYKKVKRANEDCSAIGV